MKCSNSKMLQHIDQDIHKVKMCKVAQNDNNILNIVNFEHIHWNIPLITNLLFLKLAVGLKSPNPPLEHWKEYLINQFSDKVKKK